MLSTLILSAAVMAAPAQEPAAAAPARDRLQAVHAHLAALQEARGFPGATFAFVLADGTEGAVVAGFADREAGVAMRPNHRMLAGSIGKTWFACLAMLLAEDGVIGLDDPLSKWLGKEPWFARLPNHDAITLRHLLRHRSGVREHVQEPAFWQAVNAERTKIWKPEELVAFVLDDEPLFAAGEGWSYADTNYILAGMAMERATGARLYDLVEQRLIRPLGLFATTPSDRMRLPGLAQGHPVLMRRMLGVPERMLDEDGRMVVNPQFEWTGGGYVSTSLDLARWAQAIGAGRVVPKARLAEMLDAVPANTGPGDRYGLGLQVRASRFGATFGHGGWFPGWLSETVYFPELGLAAAIQINTDDMRSLGAPPYQRLLELVGLLVDGKGD
ncbi:MAG TPA: serine hydrolase domain-containing protein [Planctomycetota bacterium]